MAGIGFRTTTRLSRSPAHERKSGRPVFATRTASAGRPIPSNARRYHLIAASVGLRTWETINIIRKGANYGYSQREGQSAAAARQRHRAAACRGQDRRADWRHGDRRSRVVPTYPVVQYGHVPDGRRRHRQRIRLHTERRCRRCAENTSSRICRPGASGTPISRRCLPPMTGIRRRSRRCTR